MYVTQLNGAKTKRCLHETRSTRIQLGCAKGTLLDNMQHAIIHIINTSITSTKIYYAANSHKLSI